MASGALPELARVMDKDLRSAQSITFPKPLKTAGPSSVGLFGEEVDTFLKLKQEASNLSD